MDIISVFLINKTSDEIVPGGLISSFTIRMPDKITGHLCCICVESSRKSTDTGYSRTKRTDQYRTSKKIVWIQRSSQNCLASFNINSNLCWTVIKKHVQVYCFTCFSTSCCRGKYRIVWGAGSLFVLQRNKGWFWMRWRLRI